MVWHQSGSPYCNTVGASATGSIGVGTTGVIGAFKAIVDATAVVSGISDVEKPTKGSFATDANMRLFP